MGGEKEDLVMFGCGQCEMSVRHSGGGVREAGYICV